MSCTGKVRVEGRRHHPAHHEKGDEWVRDQFDSVHVRLSLPLKTFHRYPHRTCDVQHSPFTGTAKYAQKSRCEHPSCDPAPLTASFGSASTGQRLHTSLEGEAWAACRNWDRGT